MVKDKKNKKTVSKKKEVIVSDLFLQDDLLRNSFMEGKISRENHLNDNLIGTIASIPKKEHMEKILTKRKNRIKNESLSALIIVVIADVGLSREFFVKEALARAAKQKGVRIKFESEHDDGLQNEDTVHEQDINDAIGIILVSDDKYYTERFNGKMLLKCSAKRAIILPNKLISLLISGDAPIYHEGKSINANSDNRDMLRLLYENNTEEETGGVKYLYKHLMNGVGFMLPFIASGGLLISIAFLIDSMVGVESFAELGNKTAVANLFTQIGTTAFSLFIPILGGYIAYSIAGKYAVTAGFVSGAIALAGGSGFLGAIIAGFIAGFLTRLLSRIFVIIPEQFNSIKVVLIYPLLSVLLTATIMIIFLNPPIRFINVSLIQFLDNMEYTSRIFFGILLGLMMAIDMGGPINKAAYIFATGSLTLSGDLHGNSIMAAVMAAGMVPPLGIALTTTFFKNKFTLTEREAGKANYLMGLFFITEGAIPFALKDPLKILPSIALGSAVSGGLTMLFKVSLVAPHGGIIVVLLASNPALYILSIFIGVLITFITLSLLKNNS